MLSPTLVGMNFHVARMTCHYLGTETGHASQTSLARPRVFYEEHGSALHPEHLGGRTACRDPRRWCIHAPRRGGFNSLKPSPPPQAYTMMRGTFRCSDVRVVSFIQYCTDRLMQEIRIRQ